MRAEIEEFVDYERTRRGVRYVREIHDLIWRELGVHRWTSFAMRIDDRIAAYRVALDTVERDAIAAHTGFKDGDGI
jgi:hypothetical protein